MFGWLERIKFWSGHFFDYLDFFRHSQTGATGDAGLDVLIRDPLEKVVRLFRILLAEATNLVLNLTYFT